MIKVLLENCFQYHLAIICKLLDLDVILIQSKRKDIDVINSELHSCYEQVEKLIRGNTMLNVQFGALDVFFKNNCVITQNKNIFSKKSSIFEFSFIYQPLLLKDYEDQIFSFITNIYPQRYNYLMSDWKSFIQGSFENICVKPISRSIMLYFLQSQVEQKWTKVQWLFICTFLPFSKFKSKFHMFNIIYPSICILSKQKIHANETQSTYSLSVFDDDGKSNLNDTDIFLVINHHDFHINHVDFDQLVFDAAQNTLWVPSKELCGQDKYNGALGGCKYCEKEYFIKKHDVHDTKISSQWYFSKNKVFQEFQKQKTENFQFHIKSSTAIQGAYAIGSVKEPNL